MSVPVAPKTSGVDKQLVVELYCAGNTADAVAKMVGCSQTYVSRVVRAAGKARPKKTYPDNVLAQLYYTEKSIYAVARKLGVHPAGVHLRLKALGIETTNKKGVDETFFNYNTEESLYWAGFLLADGCRTGNKLALRLAERDGYHVENFKKAIRSQHKVHKRKLPHACYHLSLSNTALNKSLERWNILPRKSLREEMPPHVTLLSPFLQRHFWRGVVDGDGCVYVPRGGYYTLSLCGSRQITGAFREFSMNICPAKANLHQDKRSPGLYSYSISGKSARIVSGFLYRGASVALDRKREMVEENVYKRVKA